MCISPQFFKDQKGNDLQKSVFYQQQQMICITPPSGSKPRSFSGDHRQDSLPGVRGGGEGSGQSPTPEDSRTGWGVGVLSVCAAALFLSRSSFLARNQPIIRKILKGQRILPAQMTSCGLC